MVIRLSDEARRYLAAFEEMTGATAVDCLPENEAVTFLVQPDDMGTAIGPDGRTVTSLEERFGRDVTLIEHADIPEIFVANVLSPAAVYDVEVVADEDEETDVAIATVDQDDMGVAIGTDGHRIERAKRLAARHFDIDDIQLTAGEDERRA